MKYIISQIPSQPITISPIKPNEICIPFDTNALLFGSFAIGALLARVGTIVNFVKSGLAVTKKINPNLEKNAKFQYAEKMLNFLDEILPGDTSAITNTETVKYISEHPETVAALIRSTSAKDITEKLFKITEEQEVSKYFK